MPKEVVSCKLPNNRSKEVVNNLINLKKLKLPDNRSKEVVNYLIIGLKKL